MEILKGNNGLCSAGSYGREGLHRIKVNDKQNAVHPSFNAE